MMTADALRQLNTGASWDEAGKNRRQGDTVRVQGALTDTNQWTFGVGVGHGTKWGTNTSWCHPRHKRPHQALGISHVRQTVTQLLIAEAAGLSVRFRSAPL